MDQRLRLMGESLDALPVNVSILDSEGTIVETNQSWREFGTRNNIQTQSDTIGINYLDVCDRAATETSTRVFNGLRELLDGERDQFSIVYPCHSPIEQRWFLLLAVPMSLEDQRQATVAHVDITASKLTERQLKQQLAHLESLAELNTILREITHAVVDQSTRQAIEQTVCTELAAADGYSGAWFAVVDKRGSVTIGTSAGSGHHLANGSAASGSEPIYGDTAVRQAIWTRKIQTTSYADKNLAFDWKEESDHAYTNHAVAAVPISYEGTLYSVLCVYTDRPTAFDTDEQAILSQLGEIIGHTIAANERKQALMSDELIEVELQIPDIFGEIPPASEWTIEITQTVAGSNNDVFMYGTTPTTDIDAVVSVVDHLDDVDLTIINEDNDEVRLFLRQVGQSVPSLLASHGWSTKNIELTNGDCYLTVHLPSGDDVRQMVETIREEFTDVELRARRQRQATSQADRPGNESALSELTDRQRTILQTAHAAGYFEWPRDATGEEIAETLGISAPTFHQHLRIGQRKLMNSIFSELPIAA
jgi:predicted DNA binding protein